MNAIVQDDVALLREYADTGAPAAFSAVVARYADFVFATALRQTRSRELAEDVTQAAFIVLARRARSIRDGASVAGFLHQTTMFAARNALRAETRRRRHERGAAIDPATADRTTGPEALDDGAVEVDRALARLRDGDRQFLMLHYFDGLNVSDLSAKLKISHEAARKRLHRALARLRAQLTRAGAATTAAAIPAAMASLLHPAVSTQALAIASTAVAGGVNGSAFTLAHQVLRGVKMLAIQKAAAVVATVAIVGSGSVVAVNRVLLAQAPANLPPPLPTTIATTRTITANPAASPPAFNGKTVIDYIFVFENMQATKDLRASLERDREESLQAERDRLDAVKKLRDQRDAAPKGSAEFDRLDKEFNAALEKNKAERKAAELKTRRDSIRAMAEQFQRMEAAIQEVGKTHGLSLPPASKPAYPPHVDAVDQNQIRALVLRRFLPRPKDAADLTQEVLKYLDDHPDISVAGLPDAPPGTPAPVIPEARPILQTGSTVVHPTSQPAAKP